MEALRNRVKGGKKVAAGRSRKAKSRNRVARHRRKAA
jgi:hypothetical protein